MNRAELEHQLLQANSYEQWLEAVASVFRQQELFFGHGTETAEDEAYWLLSHVLGWDAQSWSLPPARALIATVVALTAERVTTRRPLAYVLGEAWFAGLRFKVDERVLIPRSPLAEIIERRFEPWCALETGDQVLDIGTGSGCLAIAAAHYCPGITVEATDNSAAALSVAAENLEQHKLRGRVRLLEADLFPPPARARRYRVIMSNPPYVPAQELSTLPSEYAHEPAAALAGGATGLELVARILAGALEYLTSDGVLIVEVGAGADALMTAFPRLPATWVEFERGGDGVFVLTGTQLDQYFRDNR